MPYGTPSLVRFTPDYIRRDTILAGREVVDLSEPAPADIEMIAMEDRQTTSGDGALSGLSAFQRLMLFAIPLGLIAVFSLRGTYKTFE